MRLLSLSLLAIALAHAADPAPAIQPTPPADTTQLPPAPPELDPAVADLKGRLPQVPSVVERDGRLWWQGQDASTAVAFVGVDERRQPQVDTVCGQVTVSRRLVEDGRLDALTALLQYAPLAKEAGLDGLRLAEGPLTGLHLRGSNALVLAGGVLRQQETAAADRAADLVELRTAIDQLKAELPKQGLDEPARRALAAILDKLPATEHSGELDDASPDFCRRVVRSGWLRQFFPAHQGDDRIEAAVRAAERQAPVMRWEGPAGMLAQVRDSFGREAWVLRSTARSAWMVEHPEPIYFGGMPSLRTVVELEAGADPLAANAVPASAKVWRQVESDWVPVVQLADGKVKECAPGSWAKAVPRRNRSPNVGDWLPAHILVTSPLGDVLTLASAGGTVVPPRDGSPAEGERFLADAARALPDAAHLDLVGQHLLRYVYDSPDPRLPTLIGNKTVKGDIHQTALQTLATASGGMIRGDCDDLAELYETIAERQGRTAHVIGVPGHAACAWAEKRADSWHVFILQTGPALEFADADLKQSLGKAYKHFDESETFDPNGLGLLLRFTDENQRGSWRLSYRVFEDPEYARIMIDVQKDWHFSTYQRGIAKMRKLIESNPKEAAETANFRELSGLYSFTGQYALAAEYHQKAIDLTADDKLSSLYMDVELIGHLFDAGKAHRAREVALDLLDRQIPAQEAKLGPSLMQVSAQLAGTLAGHQARDLALRALRPGLVMFNARLVEMLGRNKQNARQAKGGDVQHPVAGLNTLGDWLEGPDFDQNLWDNHPALQQYRRLAQYLANTAIACLEDASQTDLAADADLQLAARFSQVWLDRVAFRDVDDPGEALTRYATAGRAYATLLGTERLQSLLDSAPVPTSLEALPTRRVGGIAQVMLDAGWIRISPNYWSGRLMELFERDRDTFDPALAAKLANQALEAAAKVAGTPLEDAQTALQNHLVGLIQALLAKDEASLRKHLKVVAERKDKDWYDDTARWLGDAARRLDLAWYDTVLQCWDSEVHYESKYFWIAWRAALGKAPKHALKAAELAVKRYPLNPAFLEELQFMRQVLAEEPR
ncbi:MAG TPA: hypothetical protein DCS97_12505 [Planctomycetes bacterium]|nr:hypothetical protein [Planctomycetota bacterium]